MYAIQACATEYRQGLKNVKITDRKVVIRAVYQTHPVPKEAYQTAGIKGNLFNLQQMDLGIFNVTSKGRPFKLQSVNSPTL